MNASQYHIIRTLRMLFRFFSSTRQVLRKNINFKLPGIINRSSKQKQEISFKFSNPALEAVIPQIKGEYLVINSRIVIKNIFG